MCFTIVIIPSIYMNQSLYYKKLKRISLIRKICPICDAINFQREVRLFFALEEVHNFYFWYDFTKFACDNVGQPF